MNIHAPLVRFVLASFAAAFVSSSTATAQCTVASPQNVHVLFDNSQSLRDSLPASYLRDVDDWFSRLIATLRPGDSLSVHPIVQTGHSVRSMEIPDDPTRFGAAAMHLMRGLQVASSSDLTRSMQELRKMVNPQTSPGCPPVLLVVTDGSLAPLEPGYTRHRAAVELRAEVARWGPDDAYVIAVLAGSGAAPAFDSQYRWRRSEDPELDRRWLNRAGADLLHFAFSRVVAWDQTDALARHLYYDPVSSFGRSWTGRAAQTPNLRGMNTRYILYRVDAPRTTNEYVSCSPDLIQDRRKHYITSAGRNHEWCYHHVLDPPDDLSSKTQGVVSEVAWADESRLDISTVPDPLFSSGQIRISDLHDPNHQPGCASELARRRLADGGWESEPDSRPLRLTVSDTADDKAVISIELHLIPGTSCYTQVHVSNSVDSLPHSDRVRVQALLAYPSDTTRRIFTRRRSADAPRWVKVSARHILTFKPLRVSLWLIKGNFTLPESNPSRRVLIGTTTVPLDSTDSGECKNVGNEDRCFSFETVYGHDVPGRAVLLGSDDAGSVPFDVDAPWNSSGPVMPWTWSAALLLGSFSLVAFLLWWGHDRWVVEALIAGRLRGSRQFWRDLWSKGFLLFFTLFMLTDAILLFTRVDAQSMKIVLVAFGTALASIAATQLLRLIRQPRQDPR